MKHLVQIACTAALISASSYSYAAQNGINYDPAHSKAFNVAQNDYNGPKGVAGMTAAINNDLMQIKNTLKFNTIKTYFSKYCNIPTGQCVPIAQLAAAAGLQILLGVYEFEPPPAHDGCHDNTDCIAWTKSQIEQAITSANAPGSTVIGIVVGNEDMYDSSGRDKADLQQRIVADINAKDL
jgi:exo-beta-1,3-glucanase (GH17 family)